MRTHLEVRQHTTDHRGMANKKDISRLALQLEDDGLQSVVANGQPGERREQDESTHRTLKSW